MAHAEAATRFDNGPDLGFLPTKITSICRRRFSSNRRPHYDERSSRLSADRRGGIAAESLPLAGGRGSALLAGFGATGRTSKMSISGRNACFRCFTTIFTFGVADPARRREGGILSARAFLGPFGPRFPPARDLSATGLPRRAGRGRARVS